MNKVSKVVVTIVLIVIVFLLFGVIVRNRRSLGHPEPFGVILFLGLISVLRAIWKKPKDKKDEEDDNNSSVLQE